MWKVSNADGTQVGDLHSTKEQADRFASLYEGNELAVLLVTEVPDVK